MSTVWKSIQDNFCMTQPQRKQISDLFLCSAGLVGWQAAISRSMSNKSCKQMCLALENGWKTTFLCFREGTTWK